MIIGLCGPEGAGKSTAAQILVSELGCIIHPFAAPLKRMLEALGVSERHLYGSQADKLEPLDILGGKSARQALQLLGTEWGREMICPDLWERAWRAGVPRKGCIADDVRFPNEVDAIQSLGGTVICIVRSGLDFSRKPKHPSEDFGALPYDRFVINNGSVQDLRDRLRKQLSIIGVDANQPRVKAE
jgi:hypothetical protein